MSLNQNKGKTPNFCTIYFKMAAAFRNPKGYCKSKTNLFT